MAQVKIEDALMDAVKQKDVVKVKALCADGDISSLDLLSLTTILLSACPEKACDDEQVIFDTLMRQRSSVHIWDQVAFSMAYGKFVATTLLRGDVQQAIDWVKALPEETEITLNHEQRLRLFMPYFDLPDAEGSPKHRLSFEQYTRNVIHFLQESRYTEINNISMAKFFDPIHARALDEYKMDYVTTLLSLNIPFNGNSELTASFFYDKHVRRKYEPNTKTFIQSTVTLCDWFDYLQSLPEEYADFLSFGYKVYFEGKDDCLPPSVVLERVPDFHHRHVIPFLGAGL